MKNILAVVAVMLITAAIFSIVAAAGYMQSKSTMNTTICKENQPCRNTTITCANNQSCSTTIQNSTGSEHQIIETDESNW
jgi:hypothetical protein